MGYTREQILEQCNMAFKNKSTFYKKGFINYRGKTTDTKEYYTEVVAEFLCNNINAYISGIERITRKTSYKTPGHDGSYDPSSNREEEKIAINSTLGQYTFRNEVDNAEDGIATISSILNSCVLMMAKDMVDIIGVCDNKVTSDIEAYVKSNRCIFGLERVSFKDIMIERLESVLKQLKDS